MPRIDSFVNASTRAATPVYTPDPLPGEKEAPVSGGIAGLPHSSYEKARAIQQQHDAEDAQSLRIMRSRQAEQAIARQNAPKRTFSTEQPSAPTPITPGWKKAEQESSVHPVAAALEAEHQQNGITDPSKRVQQFSLMYSHVTGNHAIEAQKKHSELLRNTLNTIQEASARGGDPRPAAIHTTAIRSSEHAIWKAAEAKMPKGGDQTYDIESVNRKREAAQAEKVERVKSEISGIYAQHADANPTLHPSHVGEAVRHTLVQKIGAANVTGAHDSAIQSLNRDLHEKTLDEMSKVGPDGKKFLDDSHPRAAAIKAGAGPRPAPRAVSASRDDELQPDKGPEYDEPQAAAAKKPRVPREERITKKQMAAHAQKLVFQHWVGSNPRPADMDHRSHFESFKQTSEAKNPMMYLKYKMGIADPEAHVERSITAGRAEAKAANAPLPTAPRESRTMKPLSTMKDLPGRRPQVEGFVKAPLGAHFDAGRGA